MSIMKIKNLILFHRSFFLAVSCEEDFLETYPTASLSQEQVGEALAVNPAAAEGTLFGIYEQMYRLGSGGGLVVKRILVSKFNTYILIYFQVIWLTLVRAIIDKHLFLNLQEQLMHNGICKLYAMAFSCIVL